MKSLILLTFDKKMVVYCADNNKVQECRYRGNETINLTWNTERFEEMWQYFEDVYAINNWEDTDIVIYCIDKKEIYLWDKVSYPVSENVKSVAIDNISNILPKVAKAKNLLKEEGLIFGWRNYVWKVYQDRCEKTIEEANYTVNDKDFVDLIYQFLIAKNANDTILITSLQENNSKIQKLEQELNEFEPYINFLQSENKFLVNPKYDNEEYKYGCELLKWAFDCKFKLTKSWKALSKDSRNDIFIIVHENWPLLNKFNFNLSMLSDISKGFSKWLDYYCWSFDNKKKPSEKNRITVNSDPVCDLSKVSNIQTKIESVNFHSSGVFRSLFTQDELISNFLNLDMSTTYFEIDNDEFICFFNVFDILVFALIYKLYVSNIQSNLSKVIEGHLSVLIDKWNNNGLSKDCRDFINYHLQK